MKKNAKKNRLFISAVFTIGFFLFQNFAMGQSIGHAYGSYCVGSMNVFYYSGSGAATAWYTDGTVIANNGSSIQVVWNSTTSSGYVNCTYNDGYGHYGSTSLYPIVISSSVTPSVSISTGSTNICSGSTATFTASPVNGGSSPYYTWYVGGSIASSGYGNTFTTSSLTNGQQVSCSMNSNASCVTTSTVNSNVITMTVSSPQTLNVTISGSTSVCQGSGTSLSASVSNPVGTLSYQWKKNGYNVTSDNQYAPAYVLVQNTVSNGDVYSCVVSSNSCANPGTSNSLTISITQPQTFSISTGISNLGYCPGANVTFTANSSHPAYNYQWSMNGSAVPGATGSTFTTTATSVAQLQSVSVSAYTGASCVSNTYATGSAQYIPFTIYAPPTVTGNLTVASGSSTTLTANGNTPTYRWYDANGNLIYTGAQYATPTTLAPGTYTYQVRGATTDGSCLTNAVSVSVIIDYSTVSYTPIYTSSTFTKTIDLSKPVGTVAGSAGISPTGGATYTIPIYAAPGTNGIQPSVAITYNSQGGDGLVGFGWNISGLSQIGRSGKNIYQNGIVTPVSYTSEDAFVLDGSRLLPITGNNGANGTVYATEVEGFAKIVSNGGTVNNPDWFQVTSKDGTIMEFGHTTDSKILTDDGQNVILWRLNRIIDINGNYIDFTYNNTFRDSRIETIKYTGNINAGLAPYNEIDFSYKGRTDQNLVYLTGASMTQKTLLDNITVKAENSTVKQYQFNYGFDNIHSLLKEVVETGSDNTQLNSTIFLYGDQPDDIALSQTTVTAEQNLDFYAGDFDADGKTDLLAAKWFYNNNDPIRHHYYYDLWSGIDLSGSSTTLMYRYTLSSSSSVKSDPKKTQMFLTSDYNKDGRDDIVLLNTSANGYGEVNKININYTGSHNPSTGYYNYTTSADYAAPYASPYTYSAIHQKGNFFLQGDFDGDGNQDYILILGNSRYAVLGVDEFKAFLTSPATSEVNKEINNFGIGTNNNPSFYAATIASADLVSTVDIDGDGKTEILVTKDYQSYVLNVQRTSPSTGYSFASSVLFNTAEITKDSKVFPGDFNGDGKMDLLVRNAAGTWKVLYSTGLGFVSVPFAFNQTVTMTGGSSDDKILIADFNGDGKSDILHGYANGTNASKLSLYYSRGGMSPFYYQQYDYANKLGLLVVGDFNGDGRSDLLNRNYWNDPADFIAIKALGKERLLSKVTDGHNNTTTFEYKNLTDKTVYPYFYDRTISLDDPANANPYNYVQLPLYAVSSIYVPNGIGGTNVTNYTYQDAIVHRTGKGFLGFKKITAKDETSGITSITENSLYTPFAQLYTTKQSSSLTATGEALSESQITSSFVDLGSNRYWQKIDKVLNIDYIAGNASETTNTYDSYGNITTSVSKVGTQSGTTVNPIETVTTVTDYGTHNTTVAAKPDQVTVSRLRSGSSSDNVTTKYYYTTSGLVASQIQFYGLPKAVTTGYSYNSFGNPVTIAMSASGVSSHVTNATFDSKGRFVLSKQLAPGTSIVQSENFTWDSKWGKPLSETSSDCITTTYEYDGFGRTKKVIGPVFTANTSLVWDVQGQNIYYSFLDFTGGKPDEKVWYDQIGRPTKKQVMGFNNQWLAATTGYDAKGNVSSSTNLYYSNETPITTTNTYDAYNRLQLVSSTINAITYNYNKLSGGNFQVVATDQTGQTTSKTTDATGKVISSNDKGGDLFFSYDSRGLQTEVKHGSTTLVTTTYDAYGRQASLVDVNAGTVTYSYDAFGQLVQQTDNTNHSYQMSYDALGRIISRQGPEGTTTYDYYKDNNGCSNNSLAKITGFNGIIKEYTYDNLKRLQTEKVTVDNTNYLTQYGYDTWSNVNKITYPSGVEVNNTYDNNGVLTQVTGGNPGAQTTLFNGTQMNGFGQFTTYTLGNGKTSQVTYQNGFATRYYTVGVQDLNLTWDYAKGNLSSRQDAIKGLTETFQYDQLNRLTQTSVNGQLQLNIGYDGTNSFSMGNITSKTDASLNYKYRDDKIHAVAYLTYPNAISQSTVGQTITYTPFLKAATINEDSYQMTFTYDPDYERIKTQASNNNVITETKYFFGNYEKQSDNNGTREVHYVTGGNGLCSIIVRENGVNSFYVPYSDHLGSILTLTDLNGNIVAQQNFDAWGRKRNPNDWTYNNVPTVPAWLYRGYTGHEMLPQFALINMNGRMYDPIQGRMLSPDNYISDPFNSQGYNRYGYALNNPLCFIDPDGNNPIVVAIIIGAAIGAYSGGTMANYGDLRPWKWDWSSGRTWGYVLGGAVVGAGSGYLGAMIAASSMPFATTAGIISGSFTYSMGMNIMTGGQVPVSVNFGFGSYDFQSGKFDYLGKKGNSFLQNVGYALGLIGNVEDALAGLHPGEVVLQTENAPEGAGKDVIGHSEIVDKNGNVLVDFGPGKSGDFYAFNPGRNDWTSYATEGTQNPTKQVIKLPNNKYTSGIVLKHINVARLTRIGNHLNSHPGFYNFILRSCSSVASRSLMFSGRYLFGGIHPYTLRLAAILSNAGITPSQYSYYLTK